MSLPFVDTSALAKLYVAEPDSDDFEMWFASAMPVEISLLTTVEMSSVFRKYVRTGRLLPSALSAIDAAFADDIDSGSLRVSDMPASIFFTWPRA